MNQNFKISKQNRNNSREQNNKITKQATKDRKESANNHLQKVL